MKKYLSLAVVFALIASLCACTGNDDTTDNTAHTHTYGEWKVVTEATCAQSGTRERVCACGEKETEIISSTEHDYRNGICTACGKTEKAPSEGLQFMHDRDGESCSVIGFGTCTDSELVIPDTYDGKPVTGIDYHAFENGASLTSVLIPGSVTSIGSGTFRYCADLRTVTLTSSVTSIGASAFAACKYLKDIYFNGTMAQWNAIEKESGWDMDMGTGWNMGMGKENYTVHCTDGDISGSK